MKVVAFIPIKLNNQRLPGKNTRQLSDGTPLCDLMFNIVTKIPEIQEIYCFCSNEEIIPFLPENIKFLKRSKNLDSSDTTANEIISAFMNVINADIYVKLQVTSPFLKPESISECIREVSNNTFDSATIVTKVNKFLWRDNKPLNYNPNNVARTQDLPRIYCETTGAYVFRKELFIKTNCCLGNNSYFKEVGLMESLDVDNLEDFQLVNSVYTCSKMNIQ